MKVLVINSGSSSIKYSVFDMNQKKKLAYGLVERIGTSDAAIDHRWLGGSHQVSKIELDHSNGMDWIFRLLVDAKFGVFRDLNELDAVGHRVVHGGSRFLRPVLVDKRVIEALKALFPLAPLHNPHNVAGMVWVKENLPALKQVAVFDTSFHLTIPKYAYLYGLPKKVSEKYGIRKYGFHGISHAYVAEQAARLLGRELSELRMITCHIGNGVSVTAINRGVSIDTSMGFTPLEGVMMGSRSGSIDPSIIPFLLKRGMSLPAVEKLLNHESGLLGVSGCSHDMRDVLQAMKAGDEDATLAIDMYVYQITKVIGSFLPILGGIDALVFTAGIGEHVPMIRERVCRRFRFLGIDLDQEKNDSISSKNEGRISSRLSKVEVLVVPTNEEWMIAKETKTLVEAGSPW